MRSHRFIHSFLYLTIQRVAKESNVKKNNDVFKFLFVLVIDWHHRAQVNFDEKILFGKITHHLDSEIRNILVKGHVWEQGFLIPF